MRKQIEQGVAWAGSSGGVLLTAVLVVVAGTWTFVALAGEVKEGDTQAFDDWAIRALRANDPDPAPTGPREVPIGPRWLQEAGRDVTGLGGIMVLTLLVGAVAGYLLLVGKRHAMWLVLAATAGALLLSTGLKGLFDRPRPAVTHFSYVYTSSFPSGHSMLSAAVYLTLGALLARLSERRLVKFYFLAVAVIVTGLVGVSRVYMGVHYPTDVLAGWTAGLVWAIACWLVARRLQDRGTIERADETSADAAGRRDERAS
ncbi:MAG: rane-associated phospholipid phosphatase [Phycisphaerales bacterium]|nr:rane-associated phospholipid phosphatase [Phycisphaerales bacterium]